MPSRNVDVVRGLVAAFNARDFEAFRSPDVDPDVALYPLRAQFEGTSYRGPDGVRRMFADFDEDWENLRIDADEIRDAEESAVVVLCRLRATGRTSRVDLDVPIGFVWRFHDGRVVEGRSYSQQSDALRAAGLG